MTSRLRTIAAIAACAAALFPAACGSDEEPASDAAAPADATATPTPEDRGGYGY